MTDSSPSICRLLPHEDADGPANMARDEALLDLVTRDPDSAALRTYGWTEPTLSLGYFQSIREVESEPRWRGVPIVRRASGGGALWHDHELTYALAIPRTHPLSRRSRDLYAAVHRVFAGLLRDVGLGADRRGAPGNEAVGPHPFLCFGDKDPEDLVIGGVKVVGSAQRRRAGAILQHGSLLVTGSRRTPELPGLVDLAAVSGDLAVWSDRLRRRLPEALGLVPDPIDWPPEVVQHARQLETDLYRNPGWTRRR